ATDLHRVGGTAAVMKQLLPWLDASAPTVDGRTIGEHAAAAPDPDGEVIAPEGAVVKLAGHEPRELRGPARVFDSEAECKAAVYDGVVQPGEIVVVRY